LVFSISLDFSFEVCSVSGRAFFLISVVVVAALSATTVCVCVEAAFLTGFFFEGWRFVCVKTEKVKELIYKL
jgi:hypothetical protein